MVKCRIGQSKTRSPPPWTLAIVRLRKSGLYDQGYCVGNQGRLLFHPSYISRTIFRRKAQISFEAAAHIVTVGCVAGITLSQELHLKRHGYWN